MNIHQLYGKVVSSVRQDKGLNRNTVKDCEQEYGSKANYSRFTFLYYSFSPSVEEEQANFIEVEVDSALLAAWQQQEGQGRALKGSKLLLSGYFYQKRWQDHSGKFCSSFRFYAYRLEPLQSVGLAFLTA